MWVRCARRSGDRASLAVSGPAKVDAGSCAALGVWRESRAHGSPTVFYPALPCPALPQLQAENRVKGLYYESCPLRTDPCPPRAPESLDALLRLRLAAGRDEGGRQFLQERLAFCARMVFALAFGFYLLANTAYALSGRKAGSIP